VSADVAGVIVAIFVAAITIVGGVGGVLAWFWKLIDRRFDAADKRIDKRFDGVDQELVGVNARLSALEIALARLEGPTRRLLPGTGR